jgi:hypothetical protein
MESFFPFRVVARIGVALTIVSLTDAACYALQSTEVAAQSGLPETPIVPLPNLSLQARATGDLTLEYSMVPPSELNRVPSSSDVQWLEDRLIKGLSNPVQTPVANMLPPSSPRRKRTFDLWCISSDKYSFETIGHFNRSGPLRDRYDNYHKGDYFSCSQVINAEFDIDEGVPTELVVRNLGTCGNCKDQKNKEFRLQEGRDGAEANDRYRRQIQADGSNLCVLWNKIDPTAANGLNDPDGSRNDRGYAGGTVVELTPLVMLPRDNTTFYAPEFELFSAFKEIAGLAYDGAVGDRIPIYLRDDGQGGSSGIPREIPWKLTNDINMFFAESQVRTKRVEARVIEVIDGPRHISTKGYAFVDPFYIAGLADPSSYIKEHEVCGAIPVDFRAIILKTQTGEYILSIKGSKFNRSDWLYNDLPQYFGAIPPQYQFAIKVADYVGTVNSRQGRNAPLLVTGHSLGGGMAQFVVGTSGSRNNRWNWRGYGFNAATIGPGCAIAMRDGKYLDRFLQFTNVRNSHDPVSGASGLLLGDIWTLRETGAVNLLHTIGSMNIAALQSISPATHRDLDPRFFEFSNHVATVPALLPGALLNWASTP